MAKAYASTVIDAPVEAVWAVARDFNGLPNWAAAVTDSVIEDGRDADSVGCIRSFHLANGSHVRERLLWLDDCCYGFSYNFETPAFPVTNYVATFELIPITAGDRTFAQWSAVFDEAPGDAGVYERIISHDVFAAGLDELARTVAGRAAPEGAVRWDGLRPAKVFCSSVIHGPLHEVWARVRDFAGMGAWHEAITAMHMLDGVRSDKVSGVRAFQFGDGALTERLTMMSDADHAFRYTIENSPRPWLNYHAGPRFLPITSSNHTLGIWTADWVASPNDDVTLITDVHQNVFQKAFDTLNTRFFPG